ncbi:MAG: hypothetical protein MJD61_02325 [Proteobacteria bacterium]|nr:hypothetical protein [Pseudomonadota bacterium]
MSNECPVLELGRDMTERGMLSALSIMKTANRGLLAYVAPGEPCGDELTLGLSPSLRQPPQLWAIRPTGACDVLAAPALSPSGRRWLAAWVHKPLGSSEVRVAALDPGSGANSKLQDRRLDQTGWRKTSVALVGDESSALAAWAETDPASGQRFIKARRVTAQGAPAGIEHTVAALGDEQAFDLGLGPVGNGATVLAYRTQSPLGSQVRLQVLDSEGRASGSSQEVSKAAFVAEHVDLATGAEGGAIMYSFTIGGASRQIRLRRIDAMGSVVGAELPVVSNPFQGTGASIALHPQGYVAAYRALRGGAVREPSIRVAFLDRVGTLIERTDVSLAAEAGDPPAIDVGNDGRMALAWSDIEAGMRRLRAVQFPCAEPRDPMALPDPALCGNARLDQDEPCDDGNQLDGDGCTALCRREPGFACLPGNPSICLARGAHAGVGQDHSCALRSDGTSRCWGANAAKQLQAPAQQLVQITSDASHNCGIEPDGTVLCWGSDYHQQLAAPKGIFMQVEAGFDFSCGLRPSGVAECWGFGHDGRTKAPAGRFEQLSTGGDHSCGLRSNGSIRCWGANEHGQLQPPAGRFVQVSSGDRHSCGLKDDGKVVCWGFDLFGQASAPPDFFTQVSAGEHVSCGLRADSSLLCWGRDRDGHLMAPAGRYKHVSAGYRHSCAVTKADTVTCWGHNESGQTNVPQAFQ